MTSHVLSMGHHPAWLWSEQDAILLRAKENSAGIASLS